MATIHDVAREAGVSIATVSRSLNGQTRVSEATRRRVLEVAQALEFTPNRAARGLVTGRLGNVGVLVPDVANPFFGPIVAGIEQVAQGRDMGVFLADSREDPDAEVHLVRRLGQQVDGVILVASRMPDESLLSLAERVPIVLVNRVVPGLPAVAVDARQGMADLLTELAERGHRTVTYLDGPSRSWSGRTKRAGLEDAAARHDVELRVLGPYAPSYAAGRASAQDVIDDGASAVVAFDDLIAWGLLTRAQELGVRVPEDLSIAGFDDAIEEGMVRPALTTVSPQGASMGSVAAQMLMRVLGGEAQPAVEMLACEVLVRGSTAAPRRAGR
ncbi:LacI family DNA-binding transcriptional regulator [Georgenia sp. H159]|uniref:LacI family DNA-binding transcriptional regulator n=1 Tax=Georgenia sp. H159 TaxID=3076115 RepID=UPI002D78F186|nr:LacI family DNA-binding transcriptional regulator [Georgenia sp. H159]